VALEKLQRALEKALEASRSEGTLKGKERVMKGFTPAAGARGPRWRLAEGMDREFVRMNSNSYLGLDLDGEVIEAGEGAARSFGAGPGAVRFISGTSLPHVELEKKLANFHGRGAGMAFSSAYAAVMGVLPALITPGTIVISDELNHSCIINAIRLASHAVKVVTPHASPARIGQALLDHSGRADRAVVVSDGVFSMRGDHAPLDEIAAACQKHEHLYAEGVVTVVDDSHGVGAFGRTGRGTEEVTGTSADILVATLGKALGVNGGYVVSTPGVIRFLRERSPFYVYSNPVTSGEAAAAAKGVEILTGPRGRDLLAKLRRLTARFEAGLRGLGYETIPGEHPIVPLMVRDTERTSRLVRFLFEHGVLATGLNFPVVPKGDEEVRFQVNASHTEADMDEVLEVLGRFKEEEARRVKAGRR
jgi:glycine C-acetyltransferase